MTQRGYWSFHEIGSPFLRLYVYVHMQEMLKKLYVFWLSYKPKQISPFGNKYQALKSLSLRVLESDDLFVCTQSGHGRAHKTNKQTKTELWYRLWCGVR